MSAPQTTVFCGCGAAYLRRDVQIPIKDIGVFECHDCGARLAMWAGRTVPVFERLPRNAPQSKHA